MAKFKVGDIVVGNDKANHEYGITTEGSRLKVTNVYIDGTFSAELIYHPTLEWYIGKEFGVCEVIKRALKPECFDLVTEGDKIVITTDGVTTTAKMYCGKEVIKKAEAKCAPGDKFDFEFGARLAMDRLVEDTKRKEKIKKELIDICGTKIGFKQFNSVYGSPISFKKTRSFSFTGTIDGTKFLEAIRVKKSPKVLSIEEFNWLHFKSGKCAIMVHTRTAYDEMLRRIKRRFCPDVPLDVIGYYDGQSGYLYYGKDEKLRYVVTTPDIDYIEASKFLKKRITMTDEDWKAFDNSDMAIRVTKDVEEDDVLLTLKCLGYTWRSGADMTSWAPGISEYYLSKDIEDGDIGYMPIEGLDTLSTSPNHVSSVKIVKKV